MRCRGAARSSSSSRSPPCRRACRPACSSAGRTSGRPRPSWPRPRPASVSPRPTTFPRVLLTGAAGAGGVMVDGRWFGPTGILAIAPQVTLPIFNTGRIGAGVDSAEARAQEAVVRYQQTIQQAFREVSDSLVEHRKRQESRIQQEALVASLRDAARLAEHPLSRRGVELPRGPGHRAPALRRRAGAGPGPARRTARRRAPVSGARRWLDVVAAAGRDPMEGAAPRPGRTISPARRSPWCVWAE